MENTRVGQATDYDRLILEVHTNGSIHPEEAIAQAATILTDHLEIFVNFREEPGGPPVDMGERQKSWLTT